MTGMDIAQTADADVLDQGLVDYVAEWTEAGLGPPYLARPGDASAFDALLNEVWKTLLPRRLTFLSATGDGLALDVVDRHILGVGVVSGSWNTGHKIVDWATKAADQTEEIATAVFELLTRFSKCDGPISVVSRRVRISTSTGMGIAVQNLRCRRPPLIEEIPDLMDRFRSGLGDLPIAWLMVSGVGEVLESGDTSALRQLRLNLQSDQELTGGNETQMIVLASAPDSARATASQAVIVAQSNGTQMLCSLDGMHSTRAAQLWILVNYRKRRA